ncbi:MAG: SIS domain-containing protein [Candidatus Latescibacterota bacterium]
MVGTTQETIAVFAKRYLEGLKQVMDRMDTGQIVAFVEELKKAYERDGQIFIIGNGGSAGTASHMACDLAKTVLGRVQSRSHRRFRVMSMTDNMPLITALGNDMGFDHVFTEQLLLYGREGDLLVVISGSGNSENIVRAASLARAMNMRTAGLLGFDGGRLLKMLDVYVLVPDFTYGYVEDLHMVMDHMITAYFCQDFESSLAALGAKERSA